MNHTNIEWVKNPPPPHIKVDEHGRWHDPMGKFAEQPGFTWNPITGCLNGCPYCYARKLANGRLKQRYLANPNLPLHALPYSSKREDPFYPRFWEERIPPHTGKKMDWRGIPVGIFVCDMGELFGDWVPTEWQQKIFDVIKANPWHRFYLLTKQPQNLIKFSPFPDNCWVGVTATNTPMLINACAHLRSIKASIKYISLEPLLDWNLYGVDTLAWRLLKDAGINWLIIGAQTKPYKPPKIEWVEEIVKAAGRVGVPVFLKDNLEPLWTLENSREPFFKFSRPSLGATDIGRLRQEMPNDG